MIRVTIPLRTVSEANSHEHWRVRQKRAKGQRHTAELVVRTAGSAFEDRTVRLPLTVTLTRIAPRSLDSDNLAGSQKHVRDGIADALGINDRDPGVTWTYAQERGAKGYYGVRIEIRRAK